jgi:hypothetical protein
MDTKFVEEYQEKLLEWQKNFFDTWLDSMKNEKMPENWDKALDLQEKVVKNYLEAQETATKLAFDLQKKFWDQYFETMHKPEVSAA